MQKEHGSYSKKNGGSSLALLTRCKVLYYCMMNIPADISIYYGDEIYFEKTKHTRLEFRSLRILFLSITQSYKHTISYTITYSGQRSSPPSSEVRLISKTDPFWNLGNPQTWERYFGINVSDDQKMKKKWNENLVDFWEKYFQLYISRFPIFQISTFPDFYFSKNPSSRTGKTHK